MSKSIATVSAVAAALLALSGATASAQSSSGEIDAASLGDPASVSGSADAPAGYLGSAGDLLPGSVTGSLPGYATGPLGSAATAACNAGSVAGLAGMGVPGSVDPVCMVLPAIAESGDHLMNGDYEGSVSAALGGVPYVGGSLARMVPTQSAADAVGGSVTQLPGS